MRRSLTILLTITLALAWIAPASAADPLRVFYAGPEDGVRAALGLAADFELVTDPARADVFVLNGVIPDPEAITVRLRQGAGLLLILGPDIAAADLDGWLGEDVRFASREEPLSLIPSPGAERDPLSDQVLWTSSPQIRQRLLLEGAELTPLVSGYEDGSLALGRGQVGNGTIFVFCGFLDQDNPQFQAWAYFNYLIYFLTSSAGARVPVDFADYAGSPVPHPREQAVLYAAMAVMVVISFAAFFLVRRYSRTHPAELDTLVTNRAEFEAREGKTDWEEIGFHRPLGGFLFALMFGLVFFVPLIVYQNLILPTYILPSAQALGIWGRVTQFFNLLWVLFDMGTSSAFIKFFAQDRVHDPRRAVQYGQVFVWWQALSGAIQVALVTAVSGSLLPRTTYALYAWSIIVHTLIQLPGFYQVFRHALTGLQRFDFAQIIDMAWALAFPMITQPLIVTLMVAWGRSHPVFGMAMGGLLGLGLAAYAGEFLCLVLGFWLYKRLGYNARLLFLAHFDWSVVKNAFRFGVFDMLASVAWMVGQAIEILITQRLVNYAEVWGNWTIAQNFIYAYQVLQTLYSNALPAISEAISHGRKMLSQYYSVMSYKWGGLISAYIGAVLLAVADRFILGATGPEFVRAAAYSIPLIVWGAIQYPSWVGDNVQLGANHPYLKSALVAAEQTIRVALAFLLLARFQVYGLVIAYFIGLLTKDVLAYFVNHKVCFPQRFYFWQSLAAPILAGAAHYIVVRWVGQLIWQGDQVTSVLVLLVGILPSFPLFAFFYGLFGGWDDEGLEELRRAVDLSSFMRPVSWLFWWATRLGASVSPIHGRFPIGIRAAARAEARQLMDERVRL